MLNVCQIRHGKEPSQNKCIYRVYTILNPKVTPTESGWLRGEMDDGRRGVVDVVWTRSLMVTCDV